MFNRKPAAGPPQIGTSNVITIERSYRLITPLMGGGVKAGENDPSFLIRPSSIRGQLRFWWRACFGGSNQPQSNEALLADMFEREAAIFGQAAYYGENSSEPKKIIGKGASSIQIEVNVTNKGEIIQHRGKSIAHFSSPYSYAAFPLRNKLVYKPDPRINIEFKLTIRLNHADQREELEKVLWAWQTFGGIGARTRRGFGVLQRIDNQVDRYAFNNKEDLCDQIAKILTTRKYWPADVPHLSTDMRLHLAKPKPTPLETWADLLKSYKKFRQERNEGDPDNDPLSPGRSRWPEPDALRRATGRRLAKHQDITHIDAYPRGEFGLPIIFQFKDQADPPETELRLEADPIASQQKGDRFASPMLLKPVASNGQLFGLVAVLEGSNLDGRQAIIKPRGGKSSNVRIRLTSAEAETIVTQADKKILSNLSVITSFLNSIEE